MTQKTDFSFPPNYAPDSKPSARAAANLKALRLLKDLESTGRDRGDLTPEEQLALAAYTGWGDSEVLNKAFPRGPYHWNLAETEIGKLLTEEELDSIRASTLNAFFTPLSLITAVYEALESAGLASAARLRVLEPAAGTGNFLGAMPAPMAARAERVAVECETLSARMLSHLYPNVKVFAKEFETVRFPSNFFDLIVSNVPFGDYKVFDPSIKQPHLKSSIHNYYFVRALEIARPGGLVVFITSRHLLDARDRRLREHLAEQAELLSAVRLPSDAFKMAGTDVVADLLVLRKRARPVSLDPERLPVWLELADTGLQGYRGEAIEINSLFVSNPKLLLGRPEAGNTYHAGRGFTVKSNAGDLAETLKAALESQLPAGTLVPPAPAEAAETGPAESAEGYDRDAKEAVDFAKLHGDAADRATRLLDIYTLVKKVIALQLIEAPDEILELGQGKLNRLYDEFKARYGYINHPRNLREFKKRSPLVPLLKALEVLTDRKGVWAKASIFSQRTIRPAVQPAETGTPKEALLRCLNEKGRVDLEYIAKLSAQAPAEAREALRGIVYETPSGELQTADHYLSGHVRAKLEEAEAAAALDPRYEENVEALRAVLPKTLGPGEIVARLGSGWVPPDVVEEFIRHLVPDYRGKVKYTETLAQWTVEPPDFFASRSAEATQVYGTSRANAVTLIADALNLRTSLVYDQVPDPKNPPKNKSIINEPETIAAQAKAAEIKLKFQSWVWEEEARAERLAGIYNTRYNCMRRRRYDGSHLTLPGASSEITLRPHQLDVVWQMLQQRATLLGHVVGAGKTMACVAAAREMKRLGIARKAMAVVPNHLTGQWADEARRLYPDIKLLVPSQEDLSASQRGELMSAVALGDYDLVTVPHSSFKLLPLRPQTVTDHLEREIDRLRQHLDELRAEGGAVARKTIKEIERHVKRMSAELREKEAAIRRDSKDTVTFEELGIDALFVDESASFKNLNVMTKMSRIAGLPTGDSQRAFDMLLKTRHVLSQGGRVVFATGTPVMNSLGEVFIQMKYLQPELLEELGLDHFDAWVQAFADTSTGLEMKPDGSGFRSNTRFNRFTNLPELSDLWRQVLDVRTAEQLQLPRPRLAGGGVQVVSVPATPALKRYTRELARRTDQVRNKLVKPDEDNLLKITSDARKAALDMRLVNPTLPPEVGTKITALVSNVTRIYRKTRDRNGTQLIFLDLSTPKGKGK